MKPEKSQRGYCGIGVYHPKTETNIGTLWRSAYCLGANFIFTIGKRYKEQTSDTVKAYKHIPLYYYLTFGEFYDNMPRDCKLVGVEFDNLHLPLETFIHPERAIYLLGAEDNGIPNDILLKCHIKVRFKSKYCLNVASAGTVVLYDRQTKRLINSHNAP